MARWGACGVLVVALTGCAGDEVEGDSGPVDPPEPGWEAPEITEMTPTSGPYGAEVTLRGRNLGGRAEDIYLEVGGGTEIYMAYPASTLVSWTETELRFRFPMPGTGETVRLRTPGGVADAGTFLPDWDMGPPLALDYTYERDLYPDLSVISPEPGVLLVLRDAPSIGGPHVHRFAPGEATTIAFERDFPALVGGALLVAPDGEIQALGLTGDEEARLVHLRTAGGTPTVTDTGLVGEGGMLAAGRDAGGLFVWLLQADQAIRYRFSDPEWLPDRGPFPVPGVHPHAAALAADGTLFVTGAQPNDDFLDDMEMPLVGVLGPSDDAFTTEEADGYRDDSIPWMQIRVAADGRALLDYTANDSGDVRRKHPPRYRDAAGTWQELSVHPSMEEGVRGTFDLAPGGGVAASWCDAGRSVQVADDLTAPAEVALWPCPFTNQVFMDPAGEPILLVSHADDTLYAARRRAP